MIRTFDGSPSSSLIESGTNPWVEVDGQPVDWVASPLPRQPCPCGEMGRVILAGVLDGTDTPQGIQRCDICSTYVGDLEAALALAQLVGGTVKFHEES